MPQSTKNWIDNASYYMLLEHWRNAPPGDPMFSGEDGEYFAKVMFDKKNAISDAAVVNASKMVGWEGRA